MSNADLYTREELNAALNHMTELAEESFAEIERHKGRVSAVRAAIIGALAGGHLEGPSGAEYCMSTLLQIADLLDIKLPDTSRVGMRREGRAVEEDYTTWPIEKFRRLIERFRESEHMASTPASYEIWHARLAPVEEAFKRLHPRAYRNWSRQFQQQVPI